MSSDYLGCLIGSNTGFLAFRANLWLRFAYTYSCTRTSHRGGDELILEAVP